MIQSYFDVPLSEKLTWFSNDGKTKRVLDYILTENFVQQYVTRCGVASDYKFESDHRLIVTELSTPSTKGARLRTRKKIEQAVLRGLSTSDRFSRKEIAKIHT